MGRKLFCDLGPWAYKISVKKEILKRHIKNQLSDVKIAKDKSDTPLPYLLKEHSSLLIRRLHGVDLTLQENKVGNIRLVCEKINGLIIHPGETFSFWLTVGKPSERKGYKEGLFIVRGKVESGIGGGLCQMGNLIHYMVLNSPLEVTELHHHSDALFPDEKRRVPFGTGTSVSYNYIDYRFQNTTEGDVQLLTWIEEGELHGELRSTLDVPYRYELTEENHHFKEENGEYYRISQVYKLTIGKLTDKVIKKELILNNHSKVMYDYALIPKEQIRG